MAEPTSLKMSDRTGWLLLAAWQCTILTPNCSSSVRACCKIVFLGTYIATAQVLEVADEWKKF